MGLQKAIKVSALALMALGGAACGGGGSSSSSGTVTPPVSVTPTPAASFSPSSLSVVSGGTGTVIVASGSTVSCTNGGSFSGSTFTAPTVTEDTVVVCTATDAAGNTVAQTLSVTVTAPVAPVIISGSITFDHVPFNTITNGLNFNAITQDPAPGVTVEAVNSAGSVLQTTTSDSNGGYSLTVEGNTNLRIRARAEMVQTSGAQWDVRVIDNTSSDAAYAVQGSLVTSGTANSTRNLNASSGWGGTSYTGARAAAPFAILAPIYESIQRVVAVDADVIFPPTFFNWSVNNRSSFDDSRTLEQNIDAGDIMTSSYIGNGRILILGNADEDTDEFDEHVVIHEWGHYFEDQLSRSDSIGGEHSLGDRLDPRVALGEGFGNALSGMMTDDPIYRDSFGTRQATGFQIDVESNNYTNEGWFNEGSVQSILYDIYDAVDDGPDTISAGLGPIYNVLTSASYTGNSFFTTIFTFLEEYRTNNTSDVAAVNALTTTQSISGTDVRATGETNTGNVANVLPLYRSVAVNGAATNICLNTTAGTINKLGNRAYLIFNVTSPGTHTLRMERRSGTSNSDPDFLVHRAGTLVGIAQSGTNNVEVNTVNLTTAGQHIIDASDFEDGTICFDFTITR